MASGKPLDPEIAKDKELRKDFDYDVSRDVNGDAIDIDDEYSELSGVIDPRILVTTSRDPSSRLGQFSKEIRLLLPTSVRLNRGNLVSEDLVGAAKAQNLTDVVLLHEHRGVPTAMTISHFVRCPMLYLQKAYPNHCHSPMVLRSWSPSTTSFSAPISPSR